MKLTTTQLIAASALAFLLNPLAASGHEFIVKPSDTRAAQGNPLDFSVIVTEVYMKPDRMPPESTAVSVVADGQAKNVELKTDDSQKRFVGRATAPRNGAFTLFGASERFKTAKRGDKANDGGIVKMEAFSKALINVAMDDDSYASPVGSRLEVVPMTNPAALRVGDKMTVRVLFDGKPVATRVQATFDGYSDQEHGYVAKTESNDNGLATIEITHKGLWLVRSKLKLDEDTDTHQHYEASANVIFAVP